MTVYKSAEITSTNAAGIGDYVYSSGDELTDEPIILSAKNTISLLAGKSWVAAADYPEMYQIGPRTGWQKVNDQLFYFLNGKALTGWIELEEEGKKYYANEDGVIQTGWQRIDGNWHYFFLLDGEMMTGWIDLAEGKKYYINEDGVMQTGWQLIDGEWYYFRPGDSGLMVTNAWAKDSKGWCYLDTDGKIIKNKWIQYKGGWYYLKSNGYMAANEYVSDSKGRCWMTASGKWDGKYR